MKGFLDLMSSLRQNRVFKKLLTLRCGRARFLVCLCVAYELCKNLIQNNLILLFGIKMSTFTAEKMEITPYFDIELIMRNSQETRMGGQILERCVTLWEEWSSQLQVHTVNTGKITYLVVWLPEEVEEAIDTAWAESPSQAYLDNSLAQTLCMGAVHSILPEVEDAGCAPAPRPTDALRHALEELGMPYKDDGPSLTRRFGVVTHYPFKGGCEICYLQSNCPKGQGQAESSTFVLPGYERSQ